MLTAATVNYPVFPRSIVLAKLGRFWKDRDATYCYPTVKRFDWIGTWMPCLRRCTGSCSWKSWWRGADHWNKNYTCYYTCKTCNYTCNTCNQTYTTCNFTILNCYIVRSCFTVICLGSGGSTMVSTIALLLEGAEIKFHSSTDTDNAEKESWTIQILFTSCLTDTFAFVRIAQKSLLSFKLNLKVLKINDKNMFV